MLHRALIVAILSSVPGLVSAEDSPPPAEDKGEAADSGTEARGGTPSADPAPQAITEPAPAPTPAPASAAPAAAPEAPGKPKPKVSDFVSSTLTFYLGDDNVLAGSADRSPNIGLHDDYPELFFEGLNAEKPAVVTETHLVLYAKAPGFIPFVDTQGAFVAEFELSRDPEDRRLVAAFKDDGSWLGATFWFRREKTGAHLELTAWPYSADRFRLGYTYDLTWGGNRVYVGNEGPVPGVRLDLRTDRFYAFAGAKSLRQLRADNDEVESYWGVLAGAGPNVAFGPEEKGRLSYDFGAGYFSRGTFQFDPFTAVPVQAFGFSHRLMFTWNQRMGASPDLKNMVNDPELRKAINILPQYDGSFGLGVSGELSTLWQTLIDPAQSDALRWEDAVAGIATAQVRFAKSMRVGVDVVYRDLDFIWFNTPSWTPYVAVPDETESRPAVYGAFWWDWYLERPKLMPGFIIGLMQPASLSAEIDGSGDRQVQVTPRADERSTLPPGVEPFTILSMKGSLRWYLSSMLSVVGEVSFTQDWNQTKYVYDAEDEVGRRVLDDRRARALGLNLLMQAKF